MNTKLHTKFAISVAYGFKNELWKGRQEQFKDIILKKNYVLSKQRKN